MICPSQVAATTCGGMQGDQLAREAAPWRAMSAAALARRSTLRSSSCPPTLPPKSFDGFPPALTRSSTLLSYWLGVSRRPCNAAECGAVQSSGGWPPAPPPPPPPPLSPPPPPP